MMVGAYELTCIRSYHERVAHYLWFGPTPARPAGLASRSHKLHGSVVWVWHMNSCEPTVHVISQGAYKVGECSYQPPHRLDSERLASQLRGWCEVDSEVTTVRACLSLDRVAGSPITTCSPWADPVNPTRMHSWCAH
jgi:hypothetical protein